MIRIFWLVKIEIVIINFKVFITNFIANLSSLKTNFLMKFAHVSVFVCNNSVLGVIINKLYFVFTKDIAEILNFGRVQPLNKFISRFTYNTYIFILYFSITY